MVIGRAHLLSFALAVTACGRGRTPVVADPPSIVPCHFAPSVGGRPDTTVVAVDGDVGASFALDPRSPAELFAFAQVYETLVRVDCQDRLVAGLADRWTVDTATGLWTLTIRPDATFSDGSPVTADDVVTSWRERRSMPGAYRDPAGPAVDLITVESARSISVHLRSPTSGGPRVLADPAFAVHRTGAALGVALGTGPYLAPSIRVGLPPATAGSPVLLSPRVAGTDPVLVVRGIPSGDPRDVIDGGADVLVTADRRVTDYVAVRSELRGDPLPADRVYLLLSTLRQPHEIDSAANAGWTAIRSSLARDVIRMPSTTLTDGWWGAPHNLLACAENRPTPRPSRAGITASARARRLIHAANDRLAGEIAQRLVALATYDAGSGDRSLSGLVPEWFERTDVPLTALGVSDSDLELALGQGAELGFLIAVPRRALDSCTAWRRLASGAPWLRPGAAIPVVEANSTLVMSTRSPAVMVDWANTLRILPSTPVRDDRR